MKSLVFNTSLSKKEIYLTMKELTNPKSEQRLFIGEVSEKGFSVMKYKPFSNNILRPKINAALKEEKSGTNIEIKATLNKCDKIGFFIMGIIICSVFTYLVSCAITSHSSESVFPALILLIFAVIIFMISALIFNLELKSTIKTLKNELNSL